MTVIDSLVAAPSVFYFTPLDIGVSAHYLCQWTLLVLHFPFLVNGNLDLTLVNVRGWLGSLHCSCAATLCSGSCSCSSSLLHHLLESPSVFYNPLT